MLSPKETERMNAAIREFITVPRHISVCAKCARYDLLFGPAYVRVPHGDVTQVTDDDLATFYNDAQEIAVNSDDVVCNAYQGITGDALHSYIEDLPWQLYYETDCEHVSRHEPEGYEDDGEYFEPSEYYQLEHRDIVRALFGDTIANDFR